MTEVRALVLTGYGLNCEAETAAAFRMAGAAADLMHAGDAVERGSSALEGYQVLAFIGGFSFGDHISSGRVYANRLRFRMGDALAEFVDGGGLVIGICNGFQTIVKLGLLPALGRTPGSGLAPQQVSIVGNDRLGYRNAWVRLTVDPESPCVFTRGLAGEQLEMPSRHGEGKIVFADDAQRRDMEARHLVPVRYADAAGKPTESWPENPNGSPGGVAGLCDASGRVFGLMPHPEAFLYAENHPHWIARRDAGVASERGLGARILENAVRAVD